MAKIDSENEAAAFQAASEHSHVEPEHRPVDGVLRDIAHDLNNMLAVILGNLELVERDASLRAAVRASVGDMVTAARQGPPLVDRLREFAKRIASRDDDDAPLVSLAVGALTELGHSVSGFVRSRDALAALKADVNAFDLVVTDYTMPGMSGLDFAVQVAALRADLPVVLMSGAIGDELRADCERLGLWEVVEKPVSMRELCVRIHAAATRSRRG